MPAPLVLYFTLTFMVICVTADEVLTGRQLNDTAEPPDLRSVGRVPPYQTSGAFGSFQGYFPRNGMSHIDMWPINADEGLAGRTINDTAETPDLRSMGRVPPYQPSGVIGSHQGYFPRAGYSHVEMWPRPSFKNMHTVSHGGVYEFDEHDSGCHKPCDEKYFSCQIGCTCIAMERRCDGAVDCKEAEDEKDCTPPCEESQNRTLCNNGKVCIKVEWLCDGDNDCGDYSDETHCGGSCTAEQYQCANGLCIHKDWMCDGDDDCLDKSDETNCTKGSCHEDQFMCNSGECISKHWRCDTAADCPDSSDEENCPVDLIRCGENEFLCDNSKCIRKAFQCDGDNDCGDWTDEDSCDDTREHCNAGEFRCGDGKCIPNRWRCDSERDCYDSVDEANCEPNSIRNCTKDEYTCLDRRCILQSWVCDGNPDCTNGEDEMKCEVHCEKDQYTCKTQVDPISTAFKKCVKSKHYCDGMKDCPDGDDEDKCPTKRQCTREDRCEPGMCITNHDGRNACSCKIGFVLTSNNYTCRDVDECIYEQNPVCSQTCSNTVGSYKCGCMTGYVLRPDGRSCKPAGESPTLLFSNRFGIRQMWLTGDNYMPVVKGLHNAVAMDYHYEKKLVFWTENNLRVIRVAQINNNNLTDVVRWGIETPSGVAVDWIHDLVFWTDSGTRRVEVTTLDGSQRAVIAANDMDKPRAITVHPGDALVFWTDWGPSPKIERSDMDGSKRKSIVVDEIFWPNGLTIDYTDSKLYWADAKHHVIEKASFDGRFRKKVTNKGLPHPFAITIFEDAIYWTDWHTRSINSVNKQTGLGIQTIKSELNIPMDIHAYHHLRQLRTYKNRCGLNNGGCSHFCLPNSDDHTCRCPVGFNLLDDGHTCEDTPEKLLLYTRKKDIRLKQLHARKQTDSLDMVIPVETIKAAVALDWDHNSNSIFWTDVEKDTINRAYLNGSHQSVVVGTNLVWPGGLAYDWITDKLYWSDSGTKRIEVANVDGTMRTLLAWDHLEEPRDIALDPKAGLMYWTVWGKTPCIEVAHMDGTNRKCLIYGNMTYPNGLALDFTNNRIYWTDGGNNTIEYANLDGTGRTILIGQNLQNPFGLDLYGDEVFWTDRDTLSIQAANKFTGKDRRTLGAGVADLREVRVFHKDRVKGTNRCEKNNGGCSHLCLLKPGGRSCACPIGIKINKDGKTCPGGPKNYLIFAHRVDIRVVSLDVPYLIDVPLPLPPLKSAFGVDVDQRTSLVYWTDTGERKIQCANRAGNKIETIIGKGLHTVDGLVIDSIGRKIYWTDGGRNSVEVAELDGSNRKVLFWTGLDSPRAIALHYLFGLMFWSDWGKSAKIERADMDGTNRKVIIETDIKWPNGLAIDKIQSRLYWNDAKVLSIESSDLYGNERRTIISNVPYPYGIVIVGQDVYWTDWRTQALHRADKATGKNSIVIRDKLEGLMDIRAVPAERDLRNVCANDNGGCSHLCLRSPHGFTCACPTGLLFNTSKSNPNEKICHNYPTNFLFFATKISISIISFDTPEQWDVPLPVNVQNAVAVDFHWERKLLYYTDVDMDVIRSINMMNMNESKVIVKGNMGIPNGLGIDWIANNMYWTDNEYKVIEVARLDGTSRKILFSNLSEPRALALFPALGYLYWSDWGQTPCIEKAYLDGSARKVIISQDVGFPNGITIDQKERRLYWTDALRHRIDTSDLNGEHRVQLIPEAKNPFGMTLFNDHIYWTDWYKKAVMRANKTSGMNVTEIRTDLEMTMEIKAVSKSKQDGWNPCMENNGGCTHLCFFREFNYICACPDVSDHRPCSTVPKKYVTLKMPNHYPSSYDYSNHTLKPPKDVPPTGSDADTGTVIVITAILTLFVIGATIIAYVCIKQHSTRGPDNKESFRDSGGHISFHNPNYSGAGGPNAEAMERRTNRFQGIFKYDKTQERVTNLYMPEGTSLLPSPPPPPQRQPPSRPATHDDFEPVTLHSYA